MYQSQDILYIVLAFCALWITAFMCWLIWQVAMILKNVNDTMAEAREKIGKIEEAISVIKSRFEKATVGLSFLGDGIRRLVEYVLDKREEKLERRAEELEKKSKKNKKLT
jgi:archaellum component FlaC